MNCVDLALSIFCIIIGTCFQWANSQTFSSLGTCNFHCSNSTVVFKSTIVSSAGLPWSFNWVWDPDGRNIIIASVTVLTGDAPMVITPTRLFPYEYNISNVPDRKVVSPRNFVSSLTVLNLTETDNLVLGIPGSASDQCKFGSCGGLPIGVIIGIVIAVVIVVIILSVIGWLRYGKKLKGCQKSQSKLDEQAADPMMCVPSQDDWTLAPSKLILGTLPSNSTSTPNNIKTGQQEIGKPAFS